MIWFCFPQKLFYPLQSYISSPSIRTENGEKAATTVCFIQCFVVTDKAFSYLQEPFGNPFMMLVLFTSFGNIKNFHTFGNPDLPNNLLRAKISIINSECVQTLLRHEMNVRL